MYSDALEFTSFEKKYIHPMSGSTPLAGEKEADARRV
jgi:hypothetical protein